MVLCVKGLFAETFGVLSETHEGVQFGVDTSLFTYSGGAAAPVITEDFNDFREGTLSQRSQVTVGNGQWSGWVVSWTAGTIDLSAYQNGSIRFWFKGPPALQNRLKVGIRSNNVTEGFESSKALLSSFGVPFDNQWHPVVIPIAPWAGPSPKARLTTMVDLFNIVVEGSSSGTQNFWVDNIRWDTALPGTLDHMEIMPNDVFVPVGTKRQFTVKGFDTNGVEVDIFPEWDFDGGPSLGTLANSEGLSNQLTAQGTPVTGVVRAFVTSPAVSTSAAVEVGNIMFTQSMNVYSDAGAGGFLGVSSGGGPGAGMILNEPSGGAPEGSLFMRATYTLDDLVSGDSWALWFVEEPDDSRFMGPYENGFLHFYVRAAKDLQVGIRSANITPGAEQSKFRLSELGVPLDNTWQEVWISIADFKLRDSNLDLNQMQTFFSIGGLSNQIGEVTSEVFDVDDVFWATANPDAPDPDKIYQGLVEKQQGSGLVRSFETLDRAITYDQALALMNFTYRKDLLKSEALLNVYNSKFTGESPFLGFRDEYDINTMNVLVSSRAAGPNAWMLLAILHYRAVSGQTTYDNMMNGLASWLLGLQDADGGIRFGFAADGTPRNEKSTEHNFDVYAAFKAYAKVTGNATYDTAADNIRTWLDTEAFNVGEGRFNVGENGGPDTGKALDVYSWAPLALSSYTSVLALAEVEFSTAHINDRTGIEVDGFDFAGALTTTVDKDAVWLEGTAHMALAYLFTGSTDTADYYLNELNKAVVPISATGQGLTYATNEGTGYGGWMMDSLNPAASSMAWYLFVHHKFNPFSPVPVIRTSIKNISNNQPASEIGWSVNVPNRWARADQYIEIDVQPVSIDSFGIQIYTDNADPSSTPQFVDPSPGNPNNIDSNPAGLLFNLNDPATSHMTLPMAWSIKDSLSDTPVTFNPTTSCPGFTAPDPAFQWHFMRDRGTPELDLDGDGAVGGECDAPAFVDGELLSVVRSQDGLQVAQGGTFVPVVDHKNFLFIEADFTPAAAQVPYRTVFIIEYFFE